METQLKNISKLMSLVLRHKPEYLGIEIDNNGWTDVKALVAKINHSGIKVDFLLIKKIVETNDKKRFVFNEDKTLIRANQGHSITIDLQLKPVIPPEILCHGTIEAFISSILKNGLKKVLRHHVHLTESIETAKAVGNRRGKPIILIIKAKDMYDDGFDFFCTENNVWLTDEVPPGFISFE